jgi:hypothetical protein
LQHPYAAIANEKLLSIGVLRKLFPEPEKIIPSFFPPLRYVSPMMHGWVAGGRRKKATGIYIVVAGWLPFVVCWANRPARDPTILARPCRAMPTQLFGMTPPQFIPVTPCITKLDPLPIIPI